MFQFTITKDIAVLELDSPLTLNSEVRPVCMPKAAVADNVICVTTGWGNTQGGDSNTINIKNQYV